MVNVKLCIFIVLFSGVFANHQNSPIYKKLLTLEDKLCIREVLFFEALNQSYEGMKAVATVMVNRKNSKEFPSTFCGVAQQSGAFSYRKNTPKGVLKTFKIKNSQEEKAVQKIDYIISQLDYGTFKESFPSNVKHYTKVNIHRTWMKQMKIYTVEGDHKFLSS